MTEFMQQVKINAIKKAKQMASLELSIWNSTHEKELKNNFGFNDNKLRERKTELLRTVKQ